MAYFICEKQGRCCPHEFYDSIEQAITDSEDGVPCDHLVEVSPVRHGRWLDGKCTACGWEEPDVCTWMGYDNEAWIETPYCPNCGAKMDLED